ncbi:MAG TPA: hypothetical protein VGK73_04735 [Polyangiaceae bacterium]
MTRVLLGGALALLAQNGCSSDEELRAAKLGEGCSLDSECQDPLICAFARCHHECNDDGDCAEKSGTRCVHSPIDGILVCQLVDDVECENDNDCPGKQQCGIDDECRERCDVDGDCTPTQVCANSGECASTLPAYNDVDGNGDIVVDGGAGTSGGGKGGSGGGGRAGSGSGGRAGSSSGMSGIAGEGGEGGSAGEGSGGRGGGNASGGSSAEGGTGDSGEAGDGGSTEPAGGTSGAAGTDGGSGGAGAGSSGAAGSSGSAGTTGEDLTESSDGVEVVENDDMAHAVPLRTGATINLPEDDHDWFVVTPPQDGRSHVVSFRLEPTPTLNPEIFIRGADFSLIASPHFSLGVTSFASLTIGPNASIYLDFRQWSTSGPSGDLRIVMETVPENDEHEPNDDVDSAAEIELGVPVYGQLLRPYSLQGVNHAQDWFEVDLVPGTATITFLHTPEEPRIFLTRTTPNNQDESFGTTQAGEINRPYTFEVDQAGPWRIGLTQYTSPPIESFVSGSKPTYLTEQYSFVVTQ